MQASAELRSIGASIASDSHNIDPGLSLGGQDLRRSIVGDARPALLILLAAVAFVLLIACANAANLLLSRAVSHQKDVAIRTALGASRFRIIRQLLSETLLLSVTAGVLGSIIGLWSVRAIAAVFPAAIPRFQSPSVDWRVIVFASTVSLLCVIVAGLFPALQVSATDPVTAINATGRSSESRSRRRFRSVLLFSEIAVSLVLLTGAGLLIRSFVQLQRVDPGYDSDDLIVAPLSLPGATYDSFDKRLQFVDSVVRNISSVPGVRFVAAAGSLPTRPVAVTDFELAGKPLDPANEPSAQVVTATPGYLRTMGIRLLAGRNFTEHDTLHSPTVVLISQAMANKYYAGDNPVGRMITMKDWGDPLPAQIIGVVADVHQISVEADPQPAVYFSFAQFPQGTLVTYIVAKTGTAPQSLFSSIRQRIWDVDAHQPVELATMEQVFADSLMRRRFTLALLAAFAMLALVLTVVGVYGVISYSVSQRAQEFGIRIAVGARPWHVLSLILSQSLRTTALGVLAGIVASLALTRAMRSLLFHISPHDPLTLALVTLLLVFLSALASWLPARRATKVDPMEALRNG
jgi:putative ABC transport system permease protein